MKGNDAIAAAAYTLVLAGSIFAVVRAFGAVFSPRVRASITRHPIVHAIWFIIAVVVLYDVLTRISASIGPRPSPNHGIQRTGASRSGQLQVVRQSRLAPAADAERWLEAAPGLTAALD
jgi:MFS-type transporter involved in bile tolerance (Atg22 family)